MTKSIQIMKHIRRFTHLILVLIPLMFGGCEKDPDHPPLKTINEDAVVTIEQLRNMYNGSPVEISGDAMLFATVIMDENLGNIYRSLIVQDETGGIYIRLTSPSWLNVGDSVRIVLDGSQLDEYNNMLQLNDIDPDSQIIKQSPERYIQPQTLTIPEITSSKQAQLIKLEEVQFTFEDTGLPFADAVNQRAMSRTLIDCEGNSIIVRTSGFADFAGEKIPEGNGSLIAVVTQFQNIMQLFIRDPAELELDGERCPPPGGDLELMSIADIRQRFSEGFNSLPPNSRLEGVIISDRENENIPGQNAYIMDDNGDGIALRFQNWHNLGIGNQVRVIISNLPLNEFNGLLQIEQIPTGNAHAIGHGDLPEPRVTTLRNLRDNFSDYESTLVLIEDVAVPGRSSFAGNIELNDGTASVNMYTYQWASFADEQVQGGLYNITAIASYYYNPQLLIRSLEDMEYLGEGDPGGDVDPVTSIDEDFQSYGNFDDIDRNGWQTIAEVGNRGWICREFGGNHYAQATAFNSQDPVNIAWLVTPPVDLDAMNNPVFEFQSAHEYLHDDAIKLYISGDFNGGNPSGATWEELDARLATPQDPRHDWIDSGSIDLSGYSGIIHIAWRYEGSHPQGNNGSFRVDNVKLFDDIK